MQMYPHLELTDQIIRMFGWPALLGAFVWAIRKWDKASETVVAVQADTVETRRMVLETLGGVNNIQTNHLVHLSDEVKKQTPLLTSMDKSLAVIATKLDR